MRKGYMERERGEGVQNETLLVIKYLKSYTKAGKTFARV